MLTAKGYLGRGRWFAAILASLGAACSEEAPAESDAGYLQQPLEITNAKGVTFKLVGKARGEARDPGAVAPSQASVARSPDTAALSDDPVVLAEGLRGVMLRDGYEYREATPPVDLAGRILSARRSKAALGTPSSLGAEPSGPDLPEREGREVFGNDNRVYRSTNTSFPYRTLVWGDQQCSGAMIGPGTMLTAAHCVYFTLHDSWVQVQQGGIGVPVRWPAYAPGVDARDANPSPYGWQQCYDVTIPTAYVNQTSAETEAAYLYDYAVIDFTTRCGARPGDATGWLGTWIYSEASLESLSTRIYGYPSSAGGASRTKGSRADYSFVAEIWGTSGSVFIDSPTTALRTTIDTSIGQSGTPYYVVDGGQTRVVGIHQSGGATSNTGRRFDADVYNFADAYSQYPQQQ